jgi:excisionase family DNA binding protein
MAMARDISTKTVLLTPKEAAERLRISESTLAKWRMTAARRLPFVKIGAKVVYDEAAIEAFIADRARISTSDAGKAA